MNQTNPTSQNNRAQINGYNFCDEHFLPADTKHLILKNWIAFTRSGFAWEQFTERLYAYLMGNCGFVAHYNRAGFWHTYFTSGDDKIRFIEQFDRRKAKNNWKMEIYASGSYSDLFNAMVSEMEKYLSVHYAACASEQKQLDLEKCEKLLNRHGLTLADALRRGANCAPSAMETATQVSLF